MKFEEVLPALREGKKIRGKRIGEFPDSAKLRWSSDEDSFWSASLKEIIADDWEIVEEKPLPCPFCGWNDVFTQLREDLGAWFVWCSRCKARGAHEHSQKSATERWNKAKR